MKIENICDLCGFNCGLIFPVFIWGELKLLCYQCFKKELEPKEFPKGELKNDL